MVHIKKSFFFLKKGEWIATHSSILAWEIPWTEEPGGLQSMGPQRVRHDWVTKCTKFNIQTQRLFCGFSCVLFHRWKSYWWLSQLNGWAARIWPLSQWATGYTAATYITVSIYVIRQHCRCNSSTYFTSKYHKIIKENDLILSICVISKMVLFGDAYSCSSLLSISSSSLSEIVK